MLGTPNKRWVSGGNQKKRSAVIRGHAVMTSTGADPGILAVASDPSLTLIGSFPNKGTFALAAARNLKNMQQLGGKKFPLDEEIHFL